MKRKVLLIQPNYNIKNDAKVWTVNPPLGPCYLAAVLEKNKIPVEIIDAYVNNYSIEQTVDLIKIKKPKYVGFSILTPAANWCSEVAKKLPKTIIKIAGGPHPSGIPIDSLKSGFDIAVIGEGEDTLLEIAQGKNLKDIKGIFFKKNTKIIENPPRPPLNPDMIPLPARHLILKGGTNKPYLSAGTRYFPWSPLLTSRGCPYNCSFCNKNIFSYKFRPRSPENIIKEIDFLVNKYKVKEINIYDDCFNFDLKRAEKIMDLIIKKDYKLSLRFSNGIRADKITKRLLLKMRRAGTDYIAYGIESGDPKILKLIPKGETIKQIKKAVILTNKVGIPVTGFFMFGLIGDTKKSMQKTIDLIRNLPFNNVILNIATPYPGTRMWDIIKSQNGKTLLNDWKDFHHGSGKMLYTFPNMATPSKVEEMYRKAYREFYFRPKYIFSQIPSLFSINRIPVILRGIKRILYSLKT